MQGISKLIDVCQIYQGMDELTRGTLHLLATGESGTANVFSYQQSEILWFLREAERFLQLKQDAVREEILSLRGRLDKED